MKIIEVNQSQKDIYNRFIMDNESGSFLQSWEWGEWQKKLGHEVFRFKVLGQDAGISAVIQLIKMSLLFGRYYLYAPYGPVLAEGQNFQFPISNFQTIINELNSKFPSSVFIRIEPKSILTPHPSPLTPFVYKSPNIQPAKTLVMDLKKTESQLLEEMHHKTRYNIKLAQKHGVEIQDEFGLTVGKGLFAKEAVELIYQTSKRQSYNARGQDYFERLVDFFAVQNSRSAMGLHVYKAVYDKQILASGIMVDFGRTRTYLFGGSSDWNKNLMAPYLLHWQAMTDAKRAGFEFYDFWGIETAAGNAPGFVRFKLGFGGESDQYAGAYDVVNKNFAYSFYTLIRKINRAAKKIRPA